jgi:glyoxylase-like metal-dependent hydrolase (beta-lactamase superfamily II)
MGVAQDNVRYSWRLMRAGEFRLDGGSMFGLIPRTVWTRSVPSDEKGRITVQHNCLLLEGGGRKVVIEVGTGNKLDPKSRELFVMGERSIEDALREAGTEPEEISAVVVSHLHFDHAGGLTRMCRAGETADWTGPASGMAGARPNHGVKRTFSNAVVYTQEREWLDALANKSVMTRTYFRDHLEPIKDQVRLVDSPRPFPTGWVPGRDEMPVMPVSYRETALPGLPGVSVFLTPGHTWGQQAVKFTDVAGQTVVFTPDVMPTVAHVGAAYNLGYDVEPYTSMVTRRWFLSEAADQGWLLVLDHEPGNPCQRVKRNDKGWFDLVGADGVG